MLAVYSYDIPTESRGQILQVRCGKTLSMINYGVEGRLLDRHIPVKLQRFATRGCILIKLPLNEGPLFFPHFSLPKI
jgi:hypothetical protein